MEELETSTGTGTDQSLREPLYPSPHPVPSTHPVTKPDKLADLITATYTPAHMVEMSTYKDPTHKGRRVYVWGPPRIWITLREGVHKGRVWC